MFVSLDCCFLTSPLLPPAALSRLPLVVLHPTSVTVFPRFLSDSLLPLSRPFTTRFPHPTLCYRPHYFRLSLLLTHPRVSPAYFLRTPRILRVTRLGPPEKVGNVNRVHGNRARPNLRSFTPPSIETFSTPSFALYSSLPTYNNTVHPSPVGDHTDVKHPLQTNYSVL